MKNYLVTFELFEPAKNYSCVRAQLQRRRFVPLQTSVWARAGDYEPEPLKKDLLQCMQQKDRLFVVDITDDDYASHNSI